MRTDIIKTAYNITSPITSALATIDSRFLAIPIISSVVTEVCDYFDDKIIERRLEKLEKEAKDAKFDITSIQHWCLTPLRKCYKNEFVLGLMAIIFDDKIRKIGLV